MHFATFTSNGHEHAGIYLDGYYPFDALLSENDGANMTMLDFIRRWEGKPLPDFPAIISQKKLQPLTQVSLKAPIPSPFRDIICLGKNYADHAKEVAETKLDTQDSRSIPTAPVYFAKSACPASAHNDEILLPVHFTKQVDYEAELAVIIGKTACRIPRDDVWDVVFGYTIMNDLTARDIQVKHGQWFFGKSLDGFCPMGPHIVSREDITPPIHLDIFCRVNGELRQSSNTANLIFDIPRIISDLSQGVTLYPGDIIATGTPAGIGHAMNPPQYLKKGDKVECEIEKIGTLTNVFC